MSAVTERRYKDVMYELNQKREATVAEISAIEDEMTNQKPISVEQYFDETIKRVDNLSFTEKKAIIRRVVTKIVATKQEVRVWGRIPLLATPENETINNNENSIFATHLLNERKVGLNVKHRHSEVEFIPYSITFSMPEPDSGRGYSKKFVANLSDTKNLD